jgi:hypothetical protein
MGKIISLPLQIVRSENDKQPPTPPTKCISNITAHAWRAGTPWKIARTANATRQKNAAHSPK